MITIANLHMKAYLYFILFLCTTNSIAQNLTPQMLSATFTTKAVSFNSAGIALSGTIYKPKHPYAAVVLVHGSGQEKRSDILAAQLASNGIAVLTYDKRGVGKSGGLYMGPEVGSNNIDSLNLNQLALDVNAAVNALAEKLKNKSIKIGLLGASQAGWVIPMAAAKNKKVNFMVIFSGPLVTTLQQLRFQFYTNGNTKFWDMHTEADALLHINTDTDRYQFSATDPQDFLKPLNISGLWLYGNKDIQVPVSLSIANLNKLIAKGKYFHYQLFPELGHNTLFAKSQEPIKEAMAWIKNLAERKIK